MRGGPAGGQGQAPGFALAVSAASLRGRGGREACLCVELRLHLAVFSDIFSKIYSQLGSEHAQGLGEQGSFSRSGYPFKRCLFLSYLAVNLQTPAAVTHARPRREPTFPQENQGVMLVFTAREDSSRDFVLALCKFMTQSLGLK